MFILLLHYDGGAEALDRLDALVPEHYATYIDRYLADGTFLLSGRRVPRTGGAILAVGADRARIEEIIAEDPFQVSGAVRYEVIEIEPTRSVIPGVPAVP